MARLAGVLMLLAMALPAPEAQAQSAAERAAASCERAIVAGARRGGAPEPVLHAIALTETGREIGGRLRPWPWAINREGEGHWFATREEALAFAKASVAAGRRSFDVGCFQINHLWHGHEFASLEAMFDQEAGGAYAARFLRQLHGELGTWAAAAGAYHSRTPEFAQRYRVRFDRIYANVAGAPLRVAEEAGVEPVEAPRRSRTRMAGGPKIITLGAAARPPIRVERGRVPPSLTQAGGPGTVVLSSRDAQL